VSPATNVTWFQAQQACALSGKRLLTNAEWQMAASGTPDPGLGGNGMTTCNTNSTGRLPTGSAPACVSNWGVADMVGNLNEWVSDWTHGPGGVTAGSIGTAWNPDTFTRATPEYGSDQVGGINDAFHDHSPQAAINPLPAAIYRGGMWGNEERAGVFMLQATLTPSSRNNALGFRCARTALVPDGTPPMR
jgi:formylglycine-generating enzyme required for sulfatase activity